MAAFYYYKVIDGSKTSICLQCFRTIGLRANDLARSQDDHVCSPEDLNLVKPKQAGSNVVEFQPAARRAMHAVPTP